MLCTINIKQFSRPQSYPINHKIYNPMTTKQEDPPTRPIDTDCAFFVRDALFPLRRDWGSINAGRGTGGRNHHQIHPALMALDRLRTDLIELRPNSTSFSNIFPRGVLLVTQSDALVENRSKSDQKSRAMEYNGQPDVDESTASVEIIPNLLTVKCMDCNQSKFLPLSGRSSNAFVREKYKSWKNPEDEDYEASREHELVICSDRVLQKDYYAQGSRKEHDRREDLPTRSMGAVEETLAREITKLQVHKDGSTDTTTGRLQSPISHSVFPSSSDKTDASASCEAFARLELLAARAAECLLVSKNDDATGKIDETRMGSALFPKSLYPVMPYSLQRNFVNRCVFKVATQKTVEAAKVASSDLPVRPRDCVRRAWKAAQNTSNTQ